MAELRVPEGIREWFGSLFRAFPDLKFEVLEMVVEADKAAVRWRATGTFTRWRTLTAATSGRMNSMYATSIATDRPFPFIAPGST